MKCYEIGRSGWGSLMICVVWCNSGGQWCCLSVLTCRGEICGDRMEVVQVRRGCVQMLMWDTGYVYWGFQFQSQFQCMKTARDGRFVRIWNLMECEDVWRWDTVEEEGSFLNSVLWRWCVWRNICIWCKNKKIKIIIILRYVGWGEKILGNSIGEFPFLYVRLHAQRCYCLQVGLVKCSLPYNIKKENAVSLTRRRNQKW